MSQPRYQSRAVPARGHALRRHRRAAVLGGATPQPATSDMPPLPAVTGTIVDARPHMLVLRVPGPHAHDGEGRLALSESTRVWYGGRAGADVLRPGRQVIVRPTADGLGADRIWVDITRVTGTIVALGKEVVEVDAGPHRGRRHVTIPPRSLGQVLVRHPRMEPGFLIDVIGIRSPHGPLAIRPGTPQPGHHTGHVTPPKITGPAPHTLRGTATWFDEPCRGAAYPALDAEGQAGGCPDAPANRAGLPFLSWGSDLLVRNECAKRSGIVSVTECGCMAARYRDRCVECGTSQRGRVVELTAASFVDFGGELDSGCFNATLTVS